MQKHKISYFKKSCVQYSPYKTVTALVAIEQIVNVMVSCPATEAVAMTLYNIFGIMITANWLSTK